MSVVLKHCSSRIRPKFRYTSNTSKQTAVLSIAQNSVTVDPEPSSQLAEPEHEPEQLAEPKPWLNEPLG
jgi:hypothetical protein